MRHLNSVSSKLRWLRGGGEPDHFHYFQPHIPQLPQQLSQQLQHYLVRHSGGLESFVRGGRPNKSQAYLGLGRMNQSQGPRVSGLHLQIRWTLPTTPQIPAISYGAFCPSDGVESFSDPQPQQRADSKRRFGLYSACPMTEQVEKPSSERVEEATKPMRRLIAGSSGHRTRTTDSG